MIQKRSLPFFSSDFDSGFALHLTSKIFSFDFYPTAINLILVQVLDFMVCHYSCSRLTDRTTGGWTHRKVTPKAH